MNQRTMTSSGPLLASALAKYIDHTLLKVDATAAEVEQVCTEAREYGFCTVCVEAKWLPTVVPLLEGSDVLPIAVIDFPGGAAPTEAKVEQARAAVAAGAREIDMVLNREALRNKDYKTVGEDIASVVKASGSAGVKVILETSELTHDEKVLACGLSKLAGAAFVKTSTGFSKKGATFEDVLLMRNTVGDAVGVKASGGVRTYSDAVAMVRAGASRLGMSASVSVMKAAPSR